MLNDQKEIKRLLDGFWKIAFDEGPPKNQGRELTAAATIFFGIILSVVNDEEAQEQMCMAARGAALDVHRLLEEYKLGNRNTPPRH